MSINELSTIGSYIEREQENITEANPSAKQEVGKMIIKKNIPEIFPTSKEANKQHNEGHHARNTKLNNTSIPQLKNQIDTIILPLKRANMQLFRSLQVA